MKTSHKLKESLYEKLLFMNITQNNPDNTAYSAKNSFKPENFYCAAPSAQSVELVGDFNNWQPMPMAYHSSTGCHWRLSPKLYCASHAPHQSQ